MLVPYISLIIILIGMVSFMTLIPSKFIAEYLRLFDMPQEARIFIFALALLNFGLSYICENHFFPVLAKWIGIFSERLASIQRTESENEQGLSRENVIKFRKWERNGKRFKILQSLYV